MDIRILKILNIEKFLEDLNYIYMFGKHLKVVFMWIK